MHTKLTPRKGLPARLDFRTLLSMVKLPRNLLVSHFFNRRRTPELPVLLDSLGNLSKRKLLCVVAFNLPWAIDLMVRACSKHMPGWQLVIFDNSSKTDCRLEIARICQMSGTPYLSLPKNPEWSPNRSHAVALNWIYANVILAKRPANFGFLDHDCFPVASPLLDRPLEQTAYGLRRHSLKVPESWYHWAGYMFFNSDLVGDTALDFNHDQIRHLDTGGRNWVRLYRHLDEDTLLAAESKPVPVSSVNGGPVFDVQCIDGAFFHIGGASYRGYGDGAADYVPTVRAAVEASLV